MRPIRHLSLFTGYGGFELGLRLAGVDFRTVGYVEIDDYCQRIIQARIRDGLLDWAPIVRDVRRADFRRLAGMVDLITAGFPCQPHSAAGGRLGSSDQRNLWPDTLRAIRDVGPRWVLLENVPGILANGYAGTVVGQLAELGYDGIGDRVPAAAVGAPHLRWRWFCLSHTTDDRRPRVVRSSSEPVSCNEVGRGQLTGPDGAAGPMADADSEREQQSGRTIGEERRRPANGGQAMADAAEQGLPHGGRATSLPPERAAQFERQRFDVAHTGSFGLRPAECEVWGRERDPAGSGGEPLADANGSRWESTRTVWEGQEEPRPVRRSAGTRRPVVSPTLPEPLSESRSVAETEPDGYGGDRLLADAEGEPDWRGGQPWCHAGGASWWAVEPALGRVVDGHPHRVDQLRALGNGIVPAVVARFLRGGLRVSGRDPSKEEK